MRKRSATSAKGWRCSPSLPDTLERAQQELALQITLDLAFIATKSAKRPAEVGRHLQPGLVSCVSRWRMSRSSSGYCMARRIFK